MQLFNNNNNNNSDFLATRMQLMAACMSCRVPKIKLTNYMKRCTSYVVDVSSNYMDKSNEMYVHYHCQNVVQNGSRDDHKECS